MLKIDMFSTANKVKGQGVGSVYNELMRMLKTHFSDEFTIEVNKYNCADISHYHTINLPFYFSTFSKKRGVKIGFVHFLPETLDDSLNMPWLFKKIFYKYVIAFYKRMDHVVVVNPTFIPKLEQYGIPKNKITYIPNFVSKQEFYQGSLEEKNLLREKYGYNPDDFIVLGTGQIQTRKGILDFVHLAQKNPQMKFIWAGGFSFGKITDGYKKLSQIVKNPPKNLSFPGIVERSKLVDFYNLASIFLLPSFNELFPMSVLEAFACGTPVIVRNLTLYTKIIKGYYADFNNLNQLNALVQSFRNNPKKLHHFSKLALDASEYYSEDHLAKIWHTFYLSQVRKD